MVTVKTCTRHTCTCSKACTRVTVVTAAPDSWASADSSGRGTVSTCQGLAQSIQAVAGARSALVKGRLSQYRQWQGHGQHLSRVGSVNTGSGRGTVSICQGSAQSIQEAKLVCLKLSSWAGCVFRGTHYNGVQASQLIKQVDLIID